MSKYKNICDLFEQVQTSTKDVKTSQELESFLKKVNSYTSLPSPEQISKIFPRFSSQEKFVQVVIDLLNDYYRDFILQNLNNDFIVGRVLLLYWSAINILILNKNKDSQTLINRIVEEMIVQESPDLNIMDWYLRGSNCVEWEPTLKEIRKYTESLKNNGLTESEEWAKEVGLTVPKSQSWRISFFLTTNAQAIEFWNIDKDKDWVFKIEAFMPPSGKQLTWSVMTIKSR